MRTGIAYETWRDCDDPRAVMTALDQLAKDTTAAGTR